MLPDAGTHLQLRLSGLSWDYFITPSLRIRLYVLRILDFPPTNLRPGPVGWSHPPESQIIQLPQ